ncbi:hypothetical protein CANCADRAFT_43947 [Tortispora caseinolytica NRRL Y-17796]|uniref:Polynucleotide 5'-hydroxyl-kinase GRC3 n=1 Tax=Tortispora caseinolytica NRRL Y-17796 TaxID=767744 RepID=A0A1E4TF07_9ASCO|nr:hypothetical protein CANCADRAFT_43947 [Tortispora caseinolytica NRRL Y-17796]
MPIDYNAPSCDPDIDDLCVGSKVVVMGAKGHGKSTFCQQLMNRFADKPIIYFDLDPGRPGFTPPGVIAATRITGPIFDAPFLRLSKNFENLATRLVSFTSAKFDIDTYIKAANDLFNSVDTADSITIINSPGWIRPAGLSILSDAMSPISNDITHVVYMKYKFEWSSPFINATSYEVPDVPAYAAHTMNNKTARDLHLSCHLRDIGNNGSFNSPLCYTQPKLFSYGKPSDHLLVAGAYFADPGLTIADPMISLNGAVVSLVFAPEVATANTKNNIPIIHDLNLITCEFICHAIVHSFILDKKVLRIVMPSHITAIPEGKNLVLVRGDLQLNEWDRFPGFIEALRGYTIPYTSPIIHVPGELPWRPRRNIGRRHN